jgi:hypothetical protein
MEALIPVEPQEGKASPQGRLSRAYKIQFVATGSPFPHILDPNLR